MDLVNKILEVNRVSNEQIFEDKNKKMFWDKIESIEKANFVDKWNKLFNKMLTDKSHPKISIFSDYDCDGVCSGSLLYRALLILGIDKRQINLIIPNRRQGYGFSKSYLPNIKDSKYLLTCDNGINTQELFDSISDNTTVIGSDHHQQEQSSSKKPNVVVVDVNSFNDKTKFKSISGTTTVWKLLLNYCVKTRRKKEFAEIFRLIDIVGLSTVSDVMQMLDENRIFVKNCLKIMNSVNAPDRWIYLRDDNDFTYKDLGWKIAPIINSDSRVNGKPENAFRLMISDDPQEIKEVAEKLKKNNEYRKSIVNDLSKEMLTDDNLKNDSFIKVIRKNDKNYQPYAGLIASRFVNYYHRPSIVVVETSEGYRGSARSIGDFDLIKDTQNIEGLEIHGHAGAAGVFFTKGNAKRIVKEFNKLVDSFDESYFDSGSFATVEINKDLRIKDVEQIMELEPFGNGFELPLFKLSHIDLSNLYFIGKDKTHMKLKVPLLHDEIEVIKWNFKEYAETNKIKKNEVYDLYGTLEINDYGKRTIQMIVSDIVK